MPFLSTPKSPSNPRGQVSGSSPGEGQRSTHFLPSRSYCPDSRCSSICHIHPVWGAGGLQGLLLLHSVKSSPHAHYKHGVQNTGSRLRGLSEPTRTTQSAPQGALPAEPRANQLAVWPFSLDTIPLTTKTIFYLKPILKPACVRAFAWSSSASGALAYLLLGFTV